MIVIKQCHQGPSSCHRGIKHKNTLSRLIGLKSDWEITACHEFFYIRYRHAFIYLAIKNALNFLVVPAITSKRVDEELGISERKNVSNFTQPRAGIVRSEVLVIKDPLELVKPCDKNVTLLFDAIVLAINVHDLFTDLIEDTIIIT